MYSNKIIRKVSSSTKEDQFICRYDPDQPFPKPSSAIEFYIQGTHAPLPFYNEQRWDKIKVALQRIISAGEKLTFAEFRSSYQSYLKDEIDFTAMEKIIDSGWCHGTVLGKLLPAIAQLALDLPKYIWQPIRLLRTAQNGSLTLSQRQAASLLANGFYSTFPSRDHARYGQINIIRIFQRKTHAKQKLKCLLNYFYEYLLNPPNGALTIIRQKMPEPFPDFSMMCKPLSKMIVLPTGKIEDEGAGMTQLDFANEYIGGGVLGYGIVQEEIRFLICPELIVSCLVCERMDHDEAILIVGAERYSNYDGYNQKFRWLPRNRENSQAIPRDAQKRFKCEVLAIDALNYAGLNYSGVQFLPKYIDRELLKAHVGFSLRTSDDEGQGIATGNWGCGAFGGDLQLKSMIQLIAASSVDRPLYYFTFGNELFAQQLDRICTHLQSKGITVGQLYRMLIGYGRSGIVRPDGLFQWIETQITT